MKVWGFSRGKHQREELLRHMSNMPKSYGVIPSSHRPIEWSMIIRQFCVFAVHHGSPTGQRRWKNRASVTEGLFLWFDVIQFCPAVCGWWVPYYRTTQQYYNSVGNRYYGRPAEQFASCQPLKVYVFIKIRIRAAIKGTPNLPHWGLILFLLEYTWVSRCGWLKIWRRHLCQVNLALTVLLSRHLNGWVIPFHRWKT